MKLLNSSKKENDIFIAPTATVIGSVTLGLESSVWFGAVIRGDSDKIIIGKRTNIQDNAVIHCDPEQPTTIGDECIIGHGAIVHGASLSNNVLIGMNATVLNGAKIGEFSIIGANSLVTSNTVIPPKSIVVGSPARIMGTVSDQQIENIKQNADSYVQKGKEYLNYYLNK